MSTRLISSRALKRRIITVRVCAFFNQPLQANVRPSSHCVRAFGQMAKWLYSSTIHTWMGKLFGSRLYAMAHARWNMYHCCVASEPRGYLRPERRCWAVDRQKRRKGVISCVFSRLLTLRLGRRLAMSCQYVRTCAAVHAYG